MKKHLKLLFLSLICTGTIASVQHLVKANESGSEYNKATTCYAMARNSETGEQYLVMIGTVCKKGGTGCTENPCVVKPGDF